MNTSGLKRVICKSRKKIKTTCPIDYQFLVFQPIKGHIGFRIDLKSNSTWSRPHK